MAKHFFTKNAFFILKKVSVFAWQVDVLW